MRTLLPFVRAQVADAVVAHAEPAIHADLVRMLSRPGYALHPEGKCRAGLFALEVYRSVRGGYDQTALMAAAAVELQMQSAYVLDQVSDENPEETRAEDLALAIALVFAGTATAAEASVGCRGGAAAMRHFFASSGGACAGQYLDAMLERRGGATLEEAHRMTRLKSGNLGAFAAGFAARLAGVETGVPGVDPGMLPLFEGLGFNLFTCAQLVDDHRDGCAPGGRSDLARSKATLPVVFFARHRPRGDRSSDSSGETSIDSDARGDGTLSPAIHDVYESSGASLYAAVLALAYLGRARAQLEHLAERGCSIGPLGRFVEGVESEAARTLGAVGAGVVA
jgi:geranylgeranyl pyrophosphate synthase